ncbi:RagB/SusD family nutrient uptake outer membrane protein [Niastella sp. OAS944]|uniref:RagB/SusD family nutrient uptake outer membrane protein n=1 Tax=Niastella sp. OAS944 TaxID=2664089 RepID=UPI00348A2BA2|nr:hypothetical protein [Chitinophagaceae bacterium OAS944]
MIMHPINNSTIGYNKRLYSTMLLTSIFISFSCKKSVEIPPPTNSIAQNAVFTTNATAIAVLTGIYSRMSSSTDMTFTGGQSITFLTSLSGDELTLLQGANTPQVQYYSNSLSAVVSPVAGSEHWSSLYNFIYKVNAAVEGLTSEKATALTPTIKNKLLGEALFLRGFFYFYLVNLYGDVPLALSTDPKINSNLGRTSKELVYYQIIKDLTEAKEKLSLNYLDQTLLNETKERIRPNSWTASSLLARVYLYVEDWANAEDAATSVIDNSRLYGLVSLNNVFLKNSREAIWQLQPTNAFFNTQEAITFIIPSSGPNSSIPVYLSKDLLNSFELNDQRKVYGNWIDTTIYQSASGILDTVAFPFKYKVSLPDNSITSNTGSTNMTEYLMVFRLAEQYLIRAEARAQQGKFDMAKSDLNIIRNRAGLDNTTVNDKSALLAGIFKERQTELFTEWGNRWFDLKRTRGVDSVMSIITPKKAYGAPWKSYQQLYPIPLGDLNLMRNMVQNEGY